nr:Blue copper protein [Ipomoea batatas]
MVTQVIKLLNSFIPLSLSSRIFLICLVLLDAAKSETYTVGDGDEWSSGTNYVAWSEKHKFMADDVIVFKYVKGQHNVYEVTESTYESCDTSSGVLGKYESGNDQVKLKEARKYWFVCDKDGHCLGGMRFGINTLCINISTVGDEVRENVLENLVDVFRTPPILTDLRSHFNASFVTESNREKNRRNRDGELYLSAQRETVSDLSFDLESPTAHEGALLMVTGVKRLENDRFFSALHRHNHSSRVKFFLVAVMLSSGGCGSKLGRKKNIGHPIFCCFAQLPNQVISQVSQSLLFLVVKSKRATGLFNPIVMPDWPPTPLA